VKQESHEQAAPRIVEHCGEQDADRHHTEKERPEVPRGLRRQAWGLLRIGAMLTMTVLECVGIATDQWFGSAADPDSPISSATMTPVFAAVALILALPLVSYLRSIDRATGYRGDRAPNMSRGSETMA
jgi:hypothetical protein